eukprot:CAMPEP_0201688254 /NCGR_PEP_ID=MMETSP0578-20130828/1996_1 /ASSEMBLY_ACC=CAM_ASM_000663 /TAXON_ID=267565 /ORGANISM="Skeletonema grethea, Strain CCMP 1804" /LENGTH=1001 /DNA_ID=CAMNT_0048172489 /DNA_START=167 /DNA_END=3172 /DNA_ORIENTATION=-
MSAIYNTINLFPTPPTEDNYTPPPFEGPTGRINRLHNFPRGRFTNDIAAIAVFSGAAAAGGDVEVSGTIGNGELLDSFRPTVTNTTIEITSTNNTNLTTTTTTTYIEEYPPVSGISYNKQDAQEYIYGIATVAILVMTLYILWGMCLILLRVGRIDWCWSLCCCRRGGGAKKKKKKDDNNDEDEEGDEDDTSINQECCCVTCRESLIAKGGCCTRNVFCGWLAGKPIRVPTMDSLRREKELKSQKLVSLSSVGGGSGVKGLGESVKGMVASAGSGEKKKKLKSGGDDGVDEEENDVVGEAEVAVAAVDTEDKVVDNDNNNDDDPQDKSNNTTTTITDEYLLKRQKSTHNTILTIRILFLLSSLLLIIFSIKLCFDGYRGINNIVDSTSNGLGVIAGHVEEIQGQVGEYIEVNEEMGRRKEEWLERTKAQIEGGGFEGEEVRPWCPLALVNEGKVEVNLSLAKLLLRGSLFKLALVDRVGEVVDGGDRELQTAAVVVDAAAATKEKVFTVVTFLDDLQNPLGGRIQGILGKVLGLNDLFGGGEGDDDDADASGVDNRIKMLVARLTELVRSLIVKVTDDIAEQEEIILPLNNDGQRGLQQPSADAVDAAITEAIVEKDGITYTILTLADNFTGTDLIINGYNVTKLFTTDVTMEIDVATLTESINEKLEDASSFLLDIFKSLQPALETIHRQATDAQESLESIVPYFTVAVVFVAILIGLTSFFIIGTILAWIRKQHWLFRCTNDNIILPIFILVGLLVWVFTTVFLTLGVLMGDYCFVSPDVQMNQIFEQTLARLSPIGYKFAYYYFNGCDSAARPILMNVAYNALISTRVGLDQFFELVTTLGEGPIRKACGLGNDNILEGDPVNALSVLANVLRTHVGGAMSAVVTVGELTLCREFYPLYQFVAHQIVCNDFINLIGPLYESLFIMSICSMMMVTLRVAWHELVEDEVDGGEKGKLEDDLGTDDAAQMDAVEAGSDGVVDTEKEKEDSAVGEVEAEEGN